MNEEYMSESLDELTNYDIDVRVVTLMSEKDDLREELRIAEEDIEENVNSQIIATFLRHMIGKVNARLTVLTRERNRRQIESRRQN